MVMTNSPTQLQHEGRTGDGPVDLGGSGSGRKKYDSVKQARADEEEDRGQGEAAALQLRRVLVGDPAADEHAGHAAEHDERPEQRLAGALGQVEVALVVLRQPRGRWR